MVSRDMWDVVSPKTGRECGRWKCVRRLTDGTVENKDSSEQVVWNKSATVNYLFDVRAHCWFKTRVGCNVESFKTNYQLCNCFRFCNFRHWNILTQTPLGLTLVDGDHSRTKSCGNCRIRTLELYYLFDLVFYYFMLNLVADSARFHYIFEHV